jgi:hypothetical protein
MNEQVPRRLRQNLAILGVLALIVTLSAAVLYAMALQARQRSRGSVCHDTMYKIAFAMADYHDTHGDYPPAVVRDGGGREMHSWRATLLPFYGINGQELLRKYDLSQPWSAPENQALRTTAPWMYRCPNSGGTHEEAETSYLMPLVWPLADKDDDASVNEPPGRKEPREISERAVAIEILGSGVHWLEPRDLTEADIDRFDRPTRQPQDPEGNGIVFGDLRFFHVRRGVGVKEFITRARAAVDSDGRWRDRLVADGVLVSPY